MNERLCRTRRILAVQSQLDRLAQWKLIDLQSKVAALENQQRRIICFMQGEPAVAEIFSSTMIRRLQSIAEMFATIASESEVQTARHRDERGRLRRTERIVETLESEARRKNELNQLVEAIEAVQRRMS